MFRARENAEAIAFYDSDARYLLISLHIIITSVCYEWWNYLSGWSKKVCGDCSRKH